MNKNSAKALVNALLTLCKMLRTLHTSVSRVRSFVRSLVRLCDHSFVRSFVGSLVRKLVLSYVRCFCEPKTGRSLVTSIPMLPAFSLSILLSCAFFSSLIGGCESYTQFSDHLQAYDKLRLIAPSEIPTYLVSVTYYSDKYMQVNELMVFLRLFLPFKKPTAVFYGLNSRRP